MPEATKKKLRRDVEGETRITETLMNLLSTYPDMPEGLKIGFSDLKQDGGFAMVPITGAVIVSEREDITGHVTQTCSYPFYLVYRTAAQASKVKIDIKEFLDSLGRWLEKLKDYPKLPEGMKVYSITRESPANLDTVYENAVQDWVIQINLQYLNEFER